MQFLKKFPFGVSAYMMDADATLLRNLTSLHHLWFVPYTMYVLKKCKQRSLHHASFPVSCILGVLLVILGRIFTPKYCWFPMNSTVERHINIVKSKDSKTQAENNYLEEYVTTDNKYHLVYVNVNCGHEFFKHITLGFFHTANNRPFLPYVLYIGVISNLLSMGPYCLMEYTMRNYVG